MFCRNCGANVPDGVKFCSVCGQPMEAAAPAVPVAPEASATPVYAAPVYATPVAAIPKKFNLKLILIAVGAAVLVLVLCLVLFSGGGAEAAVEDYLDAYFNGDLSDVEDMLPKAVWDKADVTPEEVEAQSSKQIDNISDDRSMYKDYNSQSFSVNILAVEELSEAELRDITNDFKKNDLEVTDACIVHYEVIGKTSSGDEVVVELDQNKTQNWYRVVKIDGNWYVVSGSYFNAKTFFNLVDQK